MTIACSLTFCCCFNVKDVSNESKRKRPSHSSSAVDCDDKTIVKKDRETSRTKQWTERLPLRDCLLLYNNNTTMTACCPLLLVVNSKLTGIFNKTASSRVLCLNIFFCYFLSLAFCYGCFCLSLPLLSYPEQRYICPTLLFTATVASC